MASESPTSAKTGISIVPAARTRPAEATRAHQDTSEILKMLRELDAEADPLAAISEGQLITIDRQTKLLELLRTVLEEVRQIRAGQDRHGLEMQALSTEVQMLKTRCDETYDRLVRATQRHAQPAASPKPA